MSQADNVPTINPPPPPGLRERCVMGATVTPIRRRKANEEPHPVSLLSFVADKPNGDGRDFWAVKRTGDYHFDCMLGKAIGEEVFTYCRKQGDDLLLFGIFSDMIKRGIYDGLEAGFIGALNVIVAKGLRAGVLR